MKNEKLVRVERTIEIYKKGTNKIVEELDINHITLGQLLEVFEPCKIQEPYGGDDPLLYDPYDISEEQMKKLDFYLQTPVDYDNKKHDYILACVGIYLDTITGNNID